MIELSEGTYRRLLEEKGLKLDEKAFVAALKGARQMRAAVARVAQYLDETPDETP